MLLVVCLFHIAYECVCLFFLFFVFFFFQAEDGIRDLVRSRGLGDVYKRQGFRNPSFWDARFSIGPVTLAGQTVIIFAASLALIVGLWLYFCLLYTSDAADERSSVDLGGRRIIKQKNKDIVSRTVCS